MPSNNFDMYYMQEPRNNFMAMRPAPGCMDVDGRSVGQCQQIYVSTNCYYGYHDLNKPTEQANTQTDCDMSELPSNAEPLHQHNPKKRRAGDEPHDLQSKKIREEVQSAKCNEPETNENIWKKNEDLLESLFWSLHGGNIFHLEQCL